MQQLKVDTTGTGDKTLFDAAASTDRTAVLEYVFYVSAAATIIVKDEAGIEYGKYTLGAAGTITAASLPSGPRFTCAGDVKINASADVTVTGHICLATSP